MALRLAVQPGSGCLHRACGGQRHGVCRVHCSRQQRASLECSDRTRCCGGSRPATRCFHRLPLPMAWLYIGSTDKNLYALNANTGTLVWKYTMGQQILSSPAVINGVVYVGSLDNNLYALDAATGALLWKYAAGGGIASSPAIVNGVVYVGCRDKDIYALNAANGALLWKSPDSFGGLQSSSATRTACFLLRVRRPGHCLKLDQSLHEG